MSPQLPCNSVVRVIVAMLCVPAGLICGDDQVKIIFTQEEVQPNNFSAIAPMGDLKSHPYDLAAVSAAIIFTDTEPPRETRFYKLEWKFIPANGGSEEIYDTAATNKFFRVKRQPGKETACWPITKRIFLAQPGIHQLRVLTDKNVEVAIETFAVKP